ncbi:hypothetical protein A7M48_23175 [Acinetobacter baumannii]|nr:hypothetical protein A7M48_23175 [Acinetobacter baumannii]
MAASRISCGTRPTIEFTFGCTLPERRQKHSEHGALFAGNFLAFVLVVLLFRCLFLIELEVVCAPDDTLGQQ